MENIIVVNPKHSEISNLRLVGIEARLYNKQAFQGIYYLFCLRLNNSCGDANNLILTLTIF